MRRESTGTRPLGDHLCRRRTHGGVRRTLNVVTENAEEASEIGGDPACWAHLVCPECGRLAEGDSAEKGICAVCGAELPTDDD